MADSEWTKDDGIGDDEDEGIGGDDQDQATRYDPSVLFWRSATFDLRNNPLAGAPPGTPVNAIGLQRPAIQDGVMSFLDVTPAVPNLTNFKEGGKAPFPFTAYRMAIRIFFPVQPSDQTGRAAVVTTIAPRAVQLAQFFARGLFSLRADESVPILERVPVDTIGAAGGLIIVGGADVASAQMMGTSRRDGFPLPDPIRLNTGGPALNARIEWANADLAYLGAGLAGVGCGSPLPPDIITTPGVFPAVVNNEVAAPPFVVSLEFWGRRGINIHAGASKRAGAQAARRMATK